MPSRDPGQRRRWQSYLPDGQLLRPEDYPGARALRGETVLPGTDFIHTADDGRETWIRVSASPFRNEAGQIEGAVAILQDVDAEKRTQQVIGESEERFRQFAEHSTDVLWIVNVESGQFDYLSPAFEDVWGEPRDAFLRDHSLWRKSLHPEDRERAAGVLQRAMVGDVVVHEYRIIRPNGTVRWIRDTCFPIRDPRGRVRKAAGIAQDITIHNQALVYVIDPDPASRKTVSVCLQEAAYSVKAFDSASDFLEIAPALVSGCVVLNLKSGAGAGLSMLSQIKASVRGLPIIGTGASGDVRLAVRALKAGAADWLELPYADETLLAAVASCLATTRNMAEGDRHAREARKRIDGLTPREREIFEGLIAGGTNKIIGKSLGISPRTVEFHRAIIMERLGTRTLPEAAVMAGAAGLPPRGE
jgi:PAS domain S-box-containing protein